MLHAHYHTHTHTHTHCYFLNPFPLAHNSLTPPAVGPSSLSSSIPQIKSCKEKAYPNKEILTLSCANANYDLRNLGNGALGRLGQSIKAALAAAENCDFKPCGYKLDAGRDVNVIDDNSFEFPIQGNTVCLE